MNEEQYGHMQTGAAPAGRPRWHTFAAGAVVLVVAVVAWALMRSADSPQGVTLSVVPPAAPVQVGSEFTVDVLLDAGTFTPTAVDLRISFDSRILQAVSIRPSELMPTELAKGLVAEGKATITVASGTKPASGSGVIARVTFKALAAGTSDVMLTAGTQAAATGYPGDVVGELVPATVTVQ